MGLYLRSVESLGDLSIVLTELTEGFSAQQVTLCSFNKPVHPDSTARLTLKHTESAGDLRKLLCHIRLFEEEDGVPAISAWVCFTPHFTYRGRSWKDSEISLLLLIHFRTDMRSTNAYSLTHPSSDFL